MSRPEIDVENDRSTLDEKPDSPPPLQFGLATLLWLMVAVGVIFGTLRWMQASTTTSLIVLVVLAVSALVVLLLVAAIAKVKDDQ